MTRSARIAVVGAGMAGLAAADALGRAGHTVALFDKGSRPGGRVASRRVEIAGHGTVSFDHGAQFVTASSALRPLIAALAAAGHAAIWPQASAADSPQPDPTARWAGIPAMSALPRQFAAGLPQAVTQAMSRHVAFLRRSPDGWRLRHLAADAANPGQVADEGDTAGPFDAVLLALPAPQAVPLLRALGHGFAARAARAAMSPCWAAMAAFAAPVAGADVLRPSSGAIAWAAREQSRPGRRAGGLDAWVIHATPAWTTAHLELPPAEASALLVTAFAALTGAPDPPLYASAHRWRHAQVQMPLGVACLWDASIGLGMCGDWCIGPRVEAAFESGLALAACVLGDAPRGTVEVAGTAASGMTVPAGDIEAEIMRQTTQRGDSASICPSEVARALAVDWRPLLGPVRASAFGLARQGRIDVLRKGRPVEPAEARGVIRLRLRRPDQQ